jgi:hypothetical protein
LVFEKNADFFAENWQNLQKIVIITSTPEPGGVSQRVIFRNMLGRKANSDWLKLYLFSEISSFLLLEIKATANI